ncbi:uncharacterized protein TNCV_1064271 [Trichonephila clavipes]|nr:uncharacterized protein TNCV_1064271 [Trichonephila clavipes]
MLTKSPFASNKALIGIDGKPKPVRRLRFGDVLDETCSALQTKSFLLAKSFLDSLATISSHKTLNPCRGVISETDLLTTSEAEILNVFSDKDVIQYTLNLSSDCTTLVLPLVWCGYYEKDVLVQVVSYPRHLTLVQNYEDSRRMPSSS